MKKHTQFLFLFALCVMCTSGCRRKPIEPETQTVPETQSETTAETQAETTAPQTESDKAASRASEKESEKETEKKTEKESETNIQQKKPTTVTASKTKTTEKAQTTDTCRYCGGQFSTVAGADGSSEYSSHVAQEEAYIRSLGKDPATYLSEAASGGSTNTGSGTTDNSGSTGYQTGSDGTLYAQCPYCFQWFSDTADSSGYSPYAEHVAAETAYANQQANEEYVQCPNCGNWVTQSEYQDHINNGW